MKPADHSLLSQLVQLGLQKLSEQASEALNGIVVEMPELAAEAPKDDAEKPAE